MYLYRHKYWLISYQHLLCIYRNAVQLAGCWHHQSIAHIGSIQALLLAVIADPARAACVGCIRNMASSSSSSSLYTLTQTRRHGVSHTFPLSLSFCILATRVSVHCSHIFTARTRFTSRVIVRFSPGPPLRRLGAFRSMAVIYSDHLSERRADWQLINTSSRGGISIGDFVSDKMGASAPVIAV